MIDDLRNSEGARSLQIVGFPAADLELEWWKHG
jgi:hypothetical protein